MREALAAANHDSVRAEPRKAAAKARQRPGLKRSSKGKTGFLKGRVGTLVAGLACVGIVSGIVINALVLQKTRHPAPLFAHHPQHPAAPEKPAAPAVPLPVVPPKPAPATAPQASPNNPPAGALKADAPSGEHPVPPETIPAVSGATFPKKPQDPVAPALNDPITQYLKAEPRSGEEPRKAQPLVRQVPPAQLLAARTEAPKPEMRVAADKQKKQAEARKPDKDIEEAQRRLIKLGFVLQADGHMGIATRKAIEQYERDHKLAVDGEVSGLLLRQLAKEASGRPQ